MSRPDDREPILPNAPPPYTQPQENVGAAIPNEPPPKYEPPKGEYPATYQGGYPPQGGYPGQGKLCCIIMGFLLFKQNAKRLQRRLSPNVLNQCTLKVFCHYTTL